MKFRRLTCDCCKTTIATGRCKSPTYVLSEVVDQSNVIFLLISKAGRETCGRLAAEPAKDELRTILHRRASPSRWVCRPPVALGRSSAVAAIQTTARRWTTISTGRCGCRRSCVTSNCPRRRRVSGRSGRPIATASWARARGSERKETRHSPAVPGRLRNRAPSDLSSLF